MWNLKKTNSENPRVECGCQGLRRGCGGEKGAGDQKTQTSVTRCLSSEDMIHRAILYKEGGTNKLTKEREFPYWSSGKDSTCWYRECGFDPWSGKRPHAERPLSPRATNYWSPRTPRAWALQGEKPSQWEACAVQLESSCLSPKLEEARLQQWSPRAAKNK